MMLGGGIPDFLFTVSLGSHLVFTEIFMTFLAVMDWHSKAWNENLCFPDNKSFSIGIHNHLICVKIGHI